MEYHYDLSRFAAAQQDSYRQALAEIQNGRKRSHWMWYIFPQIHGLGKSSTSQLYAIQSLDEAKAFLSHPCLGKNLLEISQALLLLDTNDTGAVFGWPDELKLKSSMTLFHQADPDQPVFQAVLDKYFNGEQDPNTLKIIRKEENSYAV